MHCMGCLISNEKVGHTKSGSQLLIRQVQGLQDDVRTRQAPISAESTLILPFQKLQNHVDIVPIQSTYRTHLIVRWRPPKKDKRKQEEGYANNAGGWV